MTYFRNVGRAGAPVFREGEVLRASAMNISGYVAAGDLNGDGLADSITSDTGAGVLKYHENVSSPGGARFSGVLLLRCEDRELRFAGSVLPAIHDVDGDGTNDVVVGMVESSRFRWMKSTPVK